MNIASIKARLLQVQQDESLFSFGDLDHVPEVADLVPELMKMEPKELAYQFLDWDQVAPDALNLLLKASARSDDSALHVANAVVRLLTAWREGEGPWVGVEDVLLRAFPRLTGPERDWVAERSAVRDKYGLVPGKDFVPMGEPSDEDQWPEDQPLPKLDTISGVQARLLRAGYNSGPITGELNDRTRRAVARFQVECGLAPTGEIDDQVRYLLGED